MRQFWLKIGTAMFWICWPALRIYLQRTHRTRVVVRAGGQLLLVRTWLSDGNWGLPGGGLHAGELPQHGAVRELQEETGLEVPSDQLIQLTTETLMLRGLRFTCTYFLADLDHMLVAQKQRGEITDIQWFHTSTVGVTGFQPDVQRALKLLVDRGLF
jgi:ADP-ribose pyrophosphatase YjhB (NUDIX family)